MKEHIQYLRQNKSLWLLLLGIFSFPFNKMVLFDYPTYFSGKFNFLETTILTIPQLVLLAGSIIVLIAKYKNLKIPNLSLVLLLVLLFLKTGGISFIIGIIFLTAISALDKNQKHLLISAFIFSAILQSALATIQILLQTDLGITLIGEPTINSTVKGIAKVRLENFELLRAYGTLPHSNILGAILGLALINTKSLKEKLLLAPGLGASLSISAAFTTWLLSLLRKSSKQISIALTILLLIVITVRQMDTKFESIRERVDQNIEVITNNYTAKEILIGGSKHFTSQKKKPWENVPTHNTYLLCFQYLGILGVILLLIALFTGFTTTPFNTVFISILMLVDHYWLTTPQGLILLIFCLTISKRNLDYHEENRKPS